MDQDEVCIPRLSSILLAVSNILNMIQIILFETIKALQFCFTKGQNFLKTQLCAMFGRTRPTYRLITDIRLFQSLFVLNGGLAN